MNNKDLSQLLRIQWHLDSYRPINILKESMENLKNLTIVWMPLNKEIKGCCSKNESDYLIILNSKQNLGSQNFTLAHELYHLLFEKADEWIICSDDNDSESEMNANAFASHLLLPEASLKNYCEKNGIGEWTLKDMISCEQHFQISHETLTARLLDNESKIKPEKNENIVDKAKRLGYDPQLYLPSSKPYNCLGHYIPLTEEIYSKDKFSIGKRNELLKSVFRSDLIDNF